MTPDVPVERASGTSARRERVWGLIGGTVGSIAGVGAALVAVVADGAAWYEAGLYPRIFESRALLAIDVYMFVMLVVGAGFSTAAIAAARRSPYPRTEAFGAGLTGLILSTIAGSILFLRLFALLNAL